jgi:glycosyltransferase involved in cell wall biosynthesis
VKLVRTEVVVDLVMLAPFGIRPKGTLGLRMLPLAQELAARGRRVTIVAPADLNPEDGGTSVEHGGVVVEHLPAAGGGLAGMARTSLRMARRARALRPGLIHLFKPKGYGAMAALLLRRVQPALPLVVDSDDWEGRGGWNERLPYPTHLKLLIDWQERTLPRLARAVTVASRALQTQVWGSGVAPERCFYLPNGIRAGRRTLPTRAEGRARLGLDERPTALLYTRFWEFPVRDVVAALVGVLAHEPALRLLVVGTGEHGEERELEALARRAGVAHALDQRGWGDEPIIAAALAAADVALYPMSDGLINRAKAPVKLLEFMQARLPIVAAGVGEVLEYLDYGACGLVVAPADPGALAAGLRTLLREPERAAELGARARQRVEAVFNWSRLAAIAEQAYEL